jgi:hypothetical protein
VPVVLGNYYDNAPLSSVYCPYFTNPEKPRGYVCASKPTQKNLRPPISPIAVRLFLAISSHTQDANPPNHGPTIQKKKQRYHHYCSYRQLFATEGKLSPFSLFSPVPIHPRYTPEEKKKCHHHHPHPPPPDNSSTTIPRPSTTS